MQINGEVEEIIVDDFIPVNEVGEPLFCQPNKNEFWVLILEKAWAKVHGSYANIVSKPSDI
jgi:calpain-15